ncbi:MAG: DUF302 domain-containing protein [Thermoplasmatales archaeon]|nr:MAG: DUF302 domain-containing protein [Thermoplasmatales archaeon]
MNYYFKKTLEMPFDHAVEKVIDELKKEGVGVLTEIDVKETFKEKLSVDFQNYKILGACNPPFAHRALQAEDKIGLMLPCNIIVQEISNHRIEVASMDPIASMQAVKNQKLKEVAEQVRIKLKSVIDKL